MLKIAKGAYTQLYGSKAFDPNNDKINFQLSDGIYITEDGAILFAKELAKNNKSLSERDKSLLAEPEKKSLEDKTYRNGQEVKEGLTDEEVTTDENVNAVQTINGTLTETNQYLLDIINGFGLKHSEITKLAPLGKTESEVDNTDANRVNANIVSNPTVNINVEGSADKQTIEEMKKFAVGLTQKLTSSINIQFEKTNSTNPGKNNGKKS